MKPSPCDVYQRHLRPLFHGYPLWRPDPANFYQHVSIGDVGYVKEGYFVRIFNAMLPWDDPSNRLLGELEPYPCLNWDQFVNIRQSRFSSGDYYSRGVASIDATFEKYVIFSVLR
jgi:hypothetical protein